MCLTATKSARFVKAASSMPSTVLSNRRLVMRTVPKVQRSGPRANLPGVDRELGFAGHRQVGKDSSDQAGELESVAATRAGNDDLGTAGQEIHLELLVGGDGVQADLGAIDRGIRACYEL
jgi:hypothetical protein